MLRVAALLCLIFLADATRAEIYKWTDERGITHFSEKDPKTFETEEISDQVEKTGNFLNFEQPIQIETPDSPQRRRPAKIDVRVQIELVEYHMNEESLKTMRKQVKAIYAAYVRWFGWNPVAKRPIKIIVFGKYAAFERYQIDNRGRFTTNRSHYSSKHKEILMHGTEFADATLGVLLHEVSHAILNMEMSSAPKFINEGLAEVFQSSSYAGKKIKLGKDPVWTEKLKHKLREGSLSHARDYLHISNAEWAGESSRVENEYYMIGWSLMRFMLSSDERIQSLRAIVNASKSRALWQGGGTGQIFDGHYPGGLNRLDAHWRAWIRAI